MLSPPASWIPLFLVLAVVLGAWCLFLWIKARPLSEHLAYIAASFLPLALGIWGSTWAITRLFYTLGRNGISAPDIFARYYAQVLERMLWGSGLTFLFLTLGVITLVVRRPKLA